MTDFKKREGGITCGDPLRGECQANLKKLAIARFYFSDSARSSLGVLARPFIKTKSPGTPGAFFRFACRGGGIRTPGPRKGSPVFKTGAINRSTTPLYRLIPQI
jgi:hypothetical protein